MSTTRTAAAALHNASQQSATTTSITSLPTALLQRQCECGAHAAGGECEDCKKKKGLIARSAAGPSASALRAATLAPTLAPIGDTLRSPGQPLDRDTRAFMESRFQHDFSNVRVHTDARAAASARALQARAWALGSDVAFATGAYAPATPAGRRLLAHELAHVVQQKRASAPALAPGAAVRISEPGDASEREAESVATRVAEGSPVAVRSHPEPDMIQREPDDSDKWWYIGGGAVGALLIAAIIYFKTRKDASDIDDPPHCGERQAKNFEPVMAGARSWIAKALDRLRAFKAKPQDAATQDVRAVLQRRFASAEPAVVEKVERVLALVQKKITPTPQTACETPERNPSCQVFQAFVTTNSNTITFCTDFFKNDDRQDKMVAIIHEMTHTLVGGKPIDDRGYRHERIFGGGSEATHLTTEAALTNAESYAECVADLAMGKPFGEPPAADVLQQCPDDWKAPIKEAMNQAQRASQNIVSELHGQAATVPALWEARWKAHMPGTPPSVDKARKTYNAVNDALARPITIVCKSNPRDACSEGDVEWQDKPMPTLSLCLTWKNRPDTAARTTSLLTGFLGWFAQIDKPVCRIAFAQIAADTLTSGRFGQPTREEVFGSPAWTPDLIRFAYVPIAPPSKGRSYQESGTKHERHSEDLKDYTQPDCHKSELRFQFTVYFWVDTMDKPRPGPFTPPSVSLKYSYPKKGQPQPTEVTDEDKAVRVHPKPGDMLKTSLKLPVNVMLDANGVFVLDVRLDDPDSQTPRHYHDEINVAPVEPCPDATTPAQPAPPPTAPPSSPAQAQPVQAQPAPPQPAPPKPPPPPPPPSECE